MTDQSEPKRKKAQEGKEPEPKERIMAAAIRLFAKKGFDAVGVRELAAEAGVSLAMVNYFYGSKKGLFKAILGHFFDSYREVIEATLPGPGPVEVKARQTLLAAANFFREHHEIVIIALTELPHDDPEMIDMKVSKISAIAALFQEHLVNPLIRATGKEVPMPIVASAIPGILVSYFLMRPVMEKVWPSGYDEEMLSSYPEVVSQIYLHGIMGLMGYKGEEV